MMRVGYALVILIVVMAFSPCCSCAADDWRIAVKADNGSGQYAGPRIHLGVYPQCMDGLDEEAGYGRDKESELFVEFSQTTRWVVGMIPGESRTWLCHIQSPASPQSYPSSIKSWDIRVGALPNSDNRPIRLSLYSLLGGFPPATADGLDLGYRLVMVDNRGMTGAPPNGATWDLPIPTEFSYSTPFWTLPQADWLPILRLSEAADSAMISEGYAMRFEQYVVAGQQDVVPEPGTLSALSLGIIGIAISAFRRRRR